jgi:hypothetical protein
MSVFAETNMNLITSDTSIELGETFNLELELTVDNDFK